jgi:predicted RNA-binding Zn ribbon-like protein
MTMLWDDFLNSLHHDWRGVKATEDRLDNPDWLVQWVKQHQLSVDHLPSPKELNALKQLRTFLHRMVTNFAANSLPSEEDVEALNKVMADGAVIRQIRRIGDRYNMSMSPLGHHWSNVQAEIAASMAKMMAEGERSRVRICDNPSCLWIYYDETRNRSKRYCDDKYCGNLIKVRRFRARQKAAAELPTKEH